MSLLKSPTGRNLLLDAARSIEKNRPRRPTDFSDDYTRYFQIVVQTSPKNLRKLDTFTAVDPTIKLTVLSNTLAT